MIQRARIVCRQGGCGVLVEVSGYCEKHAKTRCLVADSNRKTSSARGYGYKWQQARSGYLKRHPLCVRCEHVGKTVPATVVDHITPHHDNQDLFWNSSNWQPLCKRCHDRKTAAEDGGFGRVAKKQL